MFTIIVRTHFWASHRVNLQDGSAEPQHSHNWSVTAEISSDRLDKNGMVADFGYLRELLEQTVAPFRDRPVESLEYFQRHGQSAEIIARYIFDELKTKLPPNTKLEHIELSEQNGCAVRYRA